MKQNSKEKIKSVLGKPEKNFFVNMLTRDIELQDAVLDLLDNCVDGALRTRSKQLSDQDSFNGFWAKITLSKQKFVIEDNCGGIPWDIAKTYAFRMGKPYEFEKPEGTIGVVGIGMKRAIFKMGRRCYVHSNHEKDSFVVTIEPHWFDDTENWDFPAARERSALKHHGTRIEISDLTNDTEQAFDEGSSLWETFEVTVSEAYSYLIAKGFQIFINGTLVKRKPFGLVFEKGARKGERLLPFVYTAKVDDVEVFFAAGYRSPLKSEEELDAEKEGSFAARDAGWTVVCNDRVVLSNDRTLKTGWGFGGVPNFHNQFSCIAGVVEFKAEDTRKLPLTTTKRSIDPGKDVYIVTLRKMQEATKHFTRNTNRWKGHESEIKKRFEQTERLDLPELKERAEQLSLRSIPGTRARQFKPELPEKTQIQTSRRISFVRPTKEIDRVSMHLFDEIREPRAVGETCFERILDQTKK